MSVSIPAHRALPAKEAALFRTLLQMYENKLFKKGIKTADTILKKFPEHGETLCMKGLILHSMDRREEGLELIRKGVRLDLTSHICWHVYGIAHKADKNYEETLKCYLQALKFDKENMNILREAAQLQCQLRQFEAHVETRNTILRLRPQLRQNWVALAVAYHMNNEDSQALVVLEQLEASVKNVAEGDAEYSDILLLHARILETWHDEAAALSFLTDNGSRIVDKVALRQIRARLLSKLGRHIEAKEAWRLLIDRNPDCTDHYREYLANEDLALDAPTDATRSKLLEALGQFEKLYPRSGAPRRLSLNIAEGDHFRRLVRSYLVAGLRRGAPSLFSDIKSLYADSSKMAIVEEVVSNIRRQLAEDNVISEDGSHDTEPPMTYLWTLFFLSQHHSYLGHFQEALLLVEEAISHTPTMPEVFMVKARILKRAGDPYGAFRWMEEARSLDGQDRFLNGKTAKYAMRVGDIDRAHALLGLFTKKDASSPAADLEDMQSLNYLQQIGDAFARLGRLGPALKRYRAIAKVFGDFEDDQFDFYSYSNRKYAFNAHLDLIGFEDQLRRHPAYVHAAISATRIYVRLFDNPDVIINENDSATKLNRKKKRLDPHAPVNGANGKQAAEPAPVADTDPEGRTLLLTKEPLQEAAVLLRPAETLVHDNVEVWLAVYDVAIRRKKYLQALRALHTISHSSPEHPELHVRLIDLACADISPAAPAIVPILNTARDKLIAQSSPSVYNSEYLRRHSAEPPAILAAARSHFIIGGSSSYSEIKRLLWQLLDRDCPADWMVCLDALSFLRLHGDQSDTTEFQSLCAAKFPLSAVFCSADDVEELRRHMEESLQVTE